MKPVALGVIHPVLPAPLPVHVTPVCAEVMFSPGAAMSGFSVNGAPKRGPREENAARVSPAFNSVTLTVPEPIAVLIALPSAWVMRKQGIVMSGSPGVGPIPTRAAAELLAMTTPTAPAACALAA